MTSINSRTKEQCAGRNKLDGVNLLEMLCDVRVLKDGGDICDDLVAYKSKGSLLDNL